MLQLGPGLELPLQAATETFGLLGTRGAGKSNAAVVMAEEMWAARIPWVAIDPKGDWWGLRAGADGTSPGLPLVIFGGLHGDITLEPGAGTFLADLIVDRNLTCVLDVSDLSKADRARLLVAFFDRLYRRHKADPTARHVFLEEAHEIIPQTVMSDDTRLKEAASRVVLLGRTGGLGATVASQRSARLHKDVLTQVGTLLAMRTLSAQDRTAIEGWVKAHEVRPDVLATLATLQPGEAWLWSPSWLGRLDRVKFRQRHTYDSGATPEVGVKSRPPATLAEVDLAAVKEAMAETVQRAEAEDPQRLRQRVAQLERELASLRAATGLPPDLVELIRRNAGGVDDAAEQVAAAVAALTGTVDMLRAAVVTATRPVPPPAAPAEDKPPARRGATTSRRPVAPKLEDHPPVDSAVPPAASGVWGQLGKADRVFFTVLARHTGGLNRLQMALLAGYRITSSTVKNSCGALRRHGLMTGPGVEPIALTDAGLALAATLQLDPLPTGRALYDYWAQRLKRHERAVLDVMVAVWPDEVDKTALAAATEYSPTSSTLKNALGRLRSLGLVVDYHAADEFVEAIRE